MPGDLNHIHRKEGNYEEAIKYAPVRDADCHYDADYGVCGR